ncbi:MAG: DUF6677 family protein [Planctomycetota bacterium]|jgi:hypothetical protein
MNGKDKDKPDPVTAAILGFLIPGGGHLYGGRFGKAVFFFVLIVGTTLAGLFLSDFHGISLKHQPYWFLGQVFAGLPAFAAAILSPDWKTVHHGVALDAGTLYTTVAGLLNILVILDAAFPMEFRILFNIEREDEVVDPHQFFETLKSTSQGTSLLALFPAMNTALQTMKSLPFVKSAEERLVLPKEIQGGIFKTASGALLVLSGIRSEEHVTELMNRFKERAKRVTLAPPGAEEKVLKKGLLKGWSAGSRQGEEAP